MDLREERELRERLERHVGRPLTDDEWEPAKRVMVQGAAQTGRSEEAAARRARRQDAGAWVAAPVCAVVGVGFLLEWDVVFSPYVLVPLGLVILLLGLQFLVIWVWGAFVGVFRREEYGGFWGWLGWLAFGWTGPLLLFAIGGAFLVSPSEYWTTPQDSDGTPAVWVGALSVFASVVLALSSPGIRRSLRAAGSRVARGLRWLPYG